MPLTEVAVRNARADEKPRKLFDAHGLFLFVTPRGGKLWRLKYRFGGKEKLLSLGPYPLLGLKDARDARDAARRMLIGGDDPGLAKATARQATLAEGKNTFRQIADEYRAKLTREGRATGTLEKIEWYLTFLIPSLGELDVRSITAAQVLEVLRVIESRGRYETARKTRSTVGAIFRYAIATARAENDPTSALRGALTRPTVKPRAAILDPTGFGGLLRAVWAYDGSPEVVAGLKLLALLFPRPGELRHAEWSEFDLDGGIWTVPADRMKMRRPHRVSLSGEAIAILNDLKAKRTHATALAFPSLRSASRCLKRKHLQRGPSPNGLHDRSGNSSRFSSFLQHDGQRKQALERGRHRALVSSRRGEVSSPRLLTRRTLGRARQYGVLVVRAMSMASHWNLTGWSATLSPVRIKQDIKKEKGTWTKQR